MNIMPFESFVVQVDYDKTVKELVEACNFDMIYDTISNPGFIPNFGPFDEKGQKELQIHLVVFDHKISNNMALKELKRQGYRPATLKELLALTITMTKSKIKKEYPIIALGSTCRSRFFDLEVPLVYCSNLRQFTVLHWWSLWSIGWRFAAVPELHENIATKPESTGQKIPSYRVSVNYDQTIEQLVMDGKYDWFSKDVTSGHFPSNEKGVAEVLVYLVNFNRDISSEDAVKELDRQGLRPATLKELLALGIAQPDLQRNNPIVALGSTWRDSIGDVRVPFLGGGGSRRRLYLLWWLGDWPSYWPFAAVQK